MNLGMCSGGRRASPASGSGHRAYDALTSQSWVIRLSRVPFLLGHGDDVESAERPVGISSKRCLAPLRGSDAAGPRSANEGRWRARSAWSGERRSRPTVSGGGPSTMWLMGSGVALMGFVHRRRRGARVSGCRGVLFLGSSRPHWAFHRVRTHSVPRRRSTS